MALNRYWQRLTRLDRIIIICLLAICVFLFAVIGLRSQGQSVLVMQDGATVFKAPLNREQTVDLHGPLGITRLEISEGRARVISSPCPFKICIGMGDVSREGEVVACVPNRLLVQVVGKTDSDRETGYDLLSR